MSSELKSVTGTKTVKQLTVESSSSSSSSSDSEDSERKASLKPQKTRDATTVESEEPKEKIDYWSKIKLRSPEADAKLEADLAVAAIQYSQHEYVKTTEVGGMIQEALNQMMDKLNAKDKII